MTEPTPLDLFRLGVFSELHGGDLHCILHGVVDTYRRLAAAKLVTVENADDDWLDIADARITPQGQAVVGAMVAAARVEIAEQNRPYVCPGCHAVAPDRCLPGCIDHELEEEQREAIESGDYSRTEDEDDN